MSTRVNLLLHEENQYEERTLNFLSLCGRKKAEILSAIVYTFLEESDIDFSKISHREMINFFRMYPLMKKAVKNAVPIAPLDIGPEKPITEVEESPKQHSAPPPPKTMTISESDPLTEEAQDRGMAALAAFGIN